MDTQSLPGGRITCPQVLLGTPETYPKTRDPEAEGENRTALAVGIWKQFCQSAHTPFLSDWLSIILWLPLMVIRTVFLWRENLG